MSEYVTKAQIDAIGTIIGNRIAARSRKVAGTIGNGSLTVIDFTHDLNSFDVLVGVHLLSGDKASRLPVVERPTLNTVRLTFAIAPTTDQYRVVVVG